MFSCWAVVTKEFLLRGINKAVIYSMYLIYPPMTRSTPGIRWLWLCCSSLQPVILKQLKHADGNFSDHQRIELNTVRPLSACSCLSHPVSTCFRWFWFASDCFVWNTRPVSTCSNQFQPVLTCSTQFAICFEPAPTYSDQCRPILSDSDLLKPVSTSLEFVLLHTCWHGI